MVTRADEPASLGLGRLGQGKRDKTLSWLKHLKTSTGPRRQSRSTKGGGGNRHQRRTAHLYGRRSIVKASFRRNQHNGKWTGHARYLARENAQHQGRGLGFDAEHDEIDMPRTVQAWERGDDKLMWSIIVAPDDGLDLKPHIRELVEGMERDLGTPLQWTAIDHRDTDQDHVHLLIRGVRDDGQELTLDRDYIRTGIRELSQAIAEQHLGPRSEHEMLVARERGIEANHWTDLDRAIQRREDADLVVSYQGFHPWSEAAQTRVRQEMDRLGNLEQLGLASRFGQEPIWQVSSEHEQTLRQMQRDHDIIKSRARQQQEQEHELG